MRKTLLLLLGVVAALPALARDFTYTYEGQTLTYSVIDEDAKTCETKGGTSSAAGNPISGALVIPSIAKDGDTEYTVESIGNYAFSKCYELTTVTIPNSVTSIGSLAFIDCTGLTSVEFGNSVTSIGIWAFCGCKGLSSVILPNSLTSIGSLAFRDCTGLTSVEFGNSVTSIGSSAFQGCRGLSSVILPNSLTSIGDAAFRDCYYLTSLTIPNSVTSIGSSAFASCYRLKSVTIPGSVKIINDETFLWTGLTAIEIPNSVISIGNRAFEGSALTSVEIPNSVSSIGNSAFYDCLSLTSVKIGDSVTSIDNSAFAGCRSLSSIVIPGSITTIGSDCFSNSINNSCGLKDVTFVYGPKSVAIGQSAFRGLTSLTWDRPTDGMNINTSELQTLCIGNTVTELTSNLFKDAAKLTSLTLGNSITSIGDNAFSGCTELTEVILPPSVEKIGTSAFEGNSKLTSIKIGHSVKSIGEKAFDSCPAYEIKITAQTPPVATNNTFSNYSGKLYVQGQDAADAYYDASESECWSWFDDPIVMTEPTSIEMEKKDISGKPGDTFQLTATLKPENVTLPHIFWRSTNPAVATVDNNGLVTLHQEVSDVKALAENADDAGPCKIIAESLYSNGPVAEVLVNAESSAIDDIINDADQSGDIDYSAPYEVYNLQGVRVGTTTDGLIPGIYIIHQGNLVKKVALR